jgi:hypothetical protein
MACLLANGRALECRESIGGIRNVYFVNHNDMGAYTIDADGELDDLGETSASFKYALNPQGSDFDEAITVSEENGTVFYEQTLNLSLPNLSKDALKNLKILTQGRFQIFVEDNNINETTGFGDLYLAGAYNGATVTGGNVGRGKAFGDMSGYNLTIVGREQRAALSVVPSTTTAATIFGGITTSSNRPSIATS